MLISIIIPSFRHARFIQRTIDSVLSQNVEVEILVLDGGSDDGTIEILRSYGDRIDWVSQPDRGQSSAINKGLRRARGQILAYLNSDDVYWPGALERVIAFFEEHTEADVVYGPATHIDIDDQEIEPYPTEPWDFDRLLDTCFICQPATFWRRSVHEQFGYFDEDLHFAMDYEFWLRVGTHKPFHYLDRSPLASTRLHDDAKTISSRVACHEQAFEVVRRHRPDYLPFAWMKHVAHVKLEYPEAGPAEKLTDPRLRSLDFIRNVLELADEHGIELGHHELGELERLIPQMEPVGAISK